MKQECTLDGTPEFCRASASSSHYRLVTSCSCAGFHLQQPHYNSDLISHYVTLLPFCPYSYSTNSIYRVPSYHILGGGRIDLSLHGGVMHQRHQRHDANLGCLLPISRLNVGFQHDPHYHRPLLPLPQTHYCPSSKTRCVLACSPVSHLQSLSIFNLVDLCLFIFSIFF